MYKKYLFFIAFFALFLGTVPLVNISADCSVVDNHDYYLGYCNNPNYGDYEHAAFYSNLEPKIIENLKVADVLLVGNSKPQFTFSANGFNDIMNENHLKYYLMGFNNEGYEFPLKLIKKYKISPKVLVINTDVFFYNGFTPVGKAAVKSIDALFIAYLKKWSVGLKQNIICPNITGYLHSIICEANSGILRSRINGRWNMISPPSAHTDFEPKEGEVDGGGDIMTTNAKKFIEISKVKPECVIMTVIAAPNNTPANAQEIARRLGINFISPKFNRLSTMDCCHLDKESSEIWTKAFADEALPIMKRCVNSN